MEKRLFFTERTEDTFNNRGLHNCEWVTSVGFHAATVEHKSVSLIAAIRTWKRKRLTMEANKCEDRQWPDYKEAIYPVLRDSGFFT